MYQKKKKNQNTQCEAHLPSYAACEVGQTSRSPAANSKHDGRAVRRERAEHGSHTSCQGTQPSEGPVRLALRVRVSCFFKCRQLVLIVWWVG